jgi:hypothetical protein
LAVVNAGRVLRRGDGEVVDGAELLDGGDAEAIELCRNPAVLENTSTSYGASAAAAGAATP